MNDPKQNLIDSINANIKLVDELMAKRNKLIDDHIQNCEDLGLNRMYDADFNA